MRPRKSNNRDPEKWQDVLVERSVRAREHMIYEWTIQYTGFAQDGILIQVGMEGCIGLLGASSLIPDHLSLWHLYMVTLASVADPRLFDPRVGDDKT